MGFAKVGEIVDAMMKRVPDRVKTSPKFKAFLEAVKEEREGESESERQRRIDDLWEDLYGE